MSQENVEILRAVWKMAADETHADDAFGAFFTADAEWHVTGVVLDQSAVYRGRDAIWAYVRSFADEFDGFRVEFENSVVAGDKIVVMNRLRGRGRRSGALVDLRFPTVVTLRGGKIVRAENYADMQRAPKAVGLSE